MKVKEESEKTGLKLNIQKTKTIASRLRPITSWQMERGKVEIMTDFIFLGSKDGDYSHDIKRCLLIEEKQWQT